MDDPILQQRIENQPESFYLKQSREGGRIPVEIIALIARFSSRWKCLLWFSIEVKLSMCITSHSYRSSRSTIDQIIANEQSNRYFLMSRINCPSHRNLVRPARLIDSLNEEELNSELGIFGSVISENGKIIFERIGGSLLRSKPVTNIEGGIASGKGFIDSILLV